MVGAASQSGGKPGESRGKTLVKRWQNPDGTGRSGPYSHAVEARPRILFVEDERSIAEPFSHALEREGFEPVVAQTAEEALRLAERIDPALVLLDLMLPDGDGRDVCRELRRRSDRPIIMLTARGTETDRIVGLELGADDYVVKPFSGPEVIARIRAVLRRSGAGRDGKRLVRVGELELDAEARRVSLGGGELELSRKEFDLLAELMANAGRVVTRDRLMADVWDENWFGSTKTLDTHIGWLRRKLGDDPAAPRFIHTVRGVGFRFAAPEELG
jgi:DNA-binding response OmpR family regulator